MHACAHTHTHQTFACVALHNFTINHKQHTSGTCFHEQTLTPFFKIKCHIYCNTYAFLCHLIVFCVVFLHIILIHFKMMIFFVKSESQSFWGRDISLSLLLFCLKVFSNPYFICHWLLCKIVSFVHSQVTIENWGKKALIESLSGKGDPSLMTSQSLCNKTENCIWLTPSKEEGYVITWKKFETFIWLNWNESSWKLRPTFAILTTCTPCFLIRVTMYLRKKWWHMVGGGKRCLRLGLVQSSGGSRYWGLFFILSCQVIHDDKSYGGKYCFFGVERVTYSRRMTLQKE